MWIGGVNPHLSHNRTHVSHSTYILLAKYMEMELRNKVSTFLKAFFTLLSLAQQSLWWGVLKWSCTYPYSYTQNVEFDFGHERSFPLLTRGGVITFDRRSSMFTRKYNRFKYRTTHIQ